MSESIQHDWRIITDKDGKPEVVQIMNAYTKAPEPYHQYFCAKCKAGIPLPLNSYRGLPWGPCLPKA